VTALAVTDESADSPPPGVNWLAFAAALLAVGGIFKILDALWGLQVRRRALQEGANGGMAEAGLRWPPPGGK
jgi:hypothetical protein